MVSMGTTQLGNWKIKLSVLNDKILCVMYNELTVDCDVRYFRDEYEANLYITYVIQSTTREDPFGY